VCFFGPSLEDGKHSPGGHPFMTALLMALVFEAGGLACKHLDRCGPGRSAEEAWTATSDSQEEARNREVTGEDSHSTPAAQGPIGNHPLMPFNVPRGTIISRRFVARVIASSAGKSGTRFHAVVDWVVPMRRPSMAKHSWMARRSAHATEGEWRRRAQQVGSPIFDAGACGRGLDPSPERFPRHRWPPLGDEQSLPGLGFTRARPAGAEVGLHGLVAGAVGRPAGTTRSLALPKDAEKPVLQFSTVAG